MIIKKFVPLLGAVLITGVATTLYLQSKPQSVSLGAGPDAGWSHHAGNEGGQKFSPLKHINTRNVQDLEIAWQIHTGDAERYSALMKHSSLQVTPILLPEQAGRSLVFCAAFNDVIAVDPETGQERWRYDARLNTKIKNSFKCRGVSYWQDVEADDGAACKHRIVSATNDRRLLSLDAITGEACPDFGGNPVPGEMAIYSGEGKMKGYAFSSSPPVLVNNTIVVGSQVIDFHYSNPPKGTVFGFDARTGQQKWAFEPIPTDPNDPAAKTWPDNPTAKSGGANAWAPLSVDSERNMVFVPTGSAAPDWYGVNRLGDNLYANSLVALDATSGKVLWHFQFVHHDLWDYDTPAQPMLVDLERDGQKVPAVVQVTKQGMIFTFHRETGEPLFPIEERPVPTSEIAGEQTSPTQPFVSPPAPLLKHGLTTEDAWGITPWDRGSCERQIAEARSEGLYTPVGESRPTVLMPGALGGMNWGGAAFSDDDQILVTNVNTTALLGQMVRIEDKDEGQESFVGSFVSMKGTPYAAKVTPLISNLGIPCVAPPWGKLVGINMRSGEILWESALGSIHEMGPVSLPFEINMGTPNMGGPLMTAGDLIFIGATMDRRFRAFDKNTGNLLWSYELPVDANANPMTYQINGRQYVVIASGGHQILPRPTGDVITAFALPAD
ncbi:pyrroloquinoline quinone-dependent dehydrogenase [Parendozoicomonas haliclonae]|uniref:Quinoprotein glucose dehydrogenase n=1 Tax=Parendozoicomonas haliclonae TaxID=1960125 RepID=A0A1X7ARH2_9GAMM|nr:pyrroloquinoline quinone-dependent dehydrogenase [Parendozoicomonas haliclonae]SMA50835.1 Quinoprotein glucose dehydrogenase [Parendozoicomonas haliclonae]